MDLVLQHEDFSRCDLGGLAGLAGPSESTGAKVLRFAVAEGFTLPDGLAGDLARQEIDWAILPRYRFADLGLIVSDMDSTLITIECVDEIAAVAGLGGEVAAITEQAMRGELDFEQSLRRRVGLLAGLPLGVLQEVYGRTLHLSPGAESLLGECRRHNVKFMLVSGGFTFFTDRLTTRLGLDYAFANILDTEGGRLTGRLNGRIIDAAAKAGLLREYRDKLNLGHVQVAAVGDGANDIPMLQEAGWGIAYRAKPKTEAAADACIRYGGLDRLRGWFV
ncbi:MAG: phosphoserine phosphatase SerB [Neisseria sp.]|nr:phosphoserine phosphatase SerB [Neisseria sp.]